MSLQSTAAFLHRDGDVIVKRSQAEKPWYLCRVSNAWERDRYYGEHMIFGETFATRDEAEARAAVLRETEQ